MIHILQVIGTCLLILFGPASLVLIPMALRQHRHTKELNAWIKTWPKETLEDISKQLREGTYDNRR